MSYLPYDIVLDTLSRLPGKTLLRLKTVSKQFHTFISDPLFQQLHHVKSLNFPFTLHAVSDSQYCHSREVLEGGTKLKLFVTDKDNALLIEFATRIDGGFFKILPSNHQLVCFLCHKKAYLCDPRAQKFLELPETSFGLMGFGFLPSKMEYKVVRLMLHVRNPRFNPNVTVGCEVLTISTKKGYLDLTPWRLVDAECPFPVEDFAVLASGHLHWKINELVRRDERDQIVTFDLQDEKFSILPPPPRLCTKHNQNPKHLCFELAGGQDNLYVLDFNVLDAVLEIWVLKNRESYLWVKQHRIEFAETEGFNPRLRYSKFPMQVLDIRKDRVLLFLILTSRLKCYDVARDAIDDYGRIDERFQLCYYTDGLLSLEKVVV